MNVVLRTMLREFRLVPTHAPEKRWHNPGVAFAPRDGGRALVYRRAYIASDSNEQRHAAVTG